VITNPATGLCLESYEFIPHSNARKIVDWIILDQGRVMVFCDDFFMSLYAENILSTRMSVHEPFKALTAIIYLNSINQLIFVMVKCGVLFEVRTGFLNNI
jgi:hypothetical protein